MLSDEQIKQFQILYKRHFNEDVTKEEALKKGIRLINLIRIIGRPINSAENSYSNNSNDFLKNK